MHIRLVFFASVREMIGTDAIDYTTCVSQIGDLRKELASQGEQWSVITDEQTLVAVNQELCDDTCVICNKDEVAFFPFMTGG